MYSKTERKSFTFARNQQNTNTAGNPPTASSMPLTVSWNDHKSGTKVPDYKELIRAGKNASSAYSAVRSSFVSAIPGSATHTIGQSAPPYHTYTTAFQGFGYTPTLPNESLAGIDTVRVNSIALSKVLKKIDSELTHLSGASVMAEFIDVIRQFGSPMRSIIDLTNRRLNRLELARRGLSGSTSFKRIKWHEIVASTYLEYAFGLAPLIGDTMKAAEALARWQTEEELLTKLRSKVVSRVTQDKTTSVTYTGEKMNSVLFNRTVKNQTEYRVQYVCGLDATPSADFGSNDRLIQLLGFQPIKWIPAIWEAVPWSWLVDYFTNVGNILEASATCTSKVTWICKTVTAVTTEDQSTKITGPVPIAGLQKGLAGSSMGSHTSKKTSITRTIPASLGVPSLYVEHPFGDYKKIANMAAVLISRKPASSALWLF